MILINKLWVRTDMPPRSSLAEADIIPVDDLQANLFRLMTGFSFSRNPAVAAEIVVQLERLLRHPSIELLPAQRAILCRALNKWRAHQALN